MQYEFKLHSLYIVANMRDIIANTMPLIRIICRGLIIYVNWVCKHTKKYVYAAVDVMRESSYDGYVPYLLFYFKLKIMRHL